MKLDLLRYARDCRMSGETRGKNLAQRIFDDLGIDPRDIEFDESTRELLGIPEDAA